MSHLSKLAAALALGLMTGPVFAQSNITAEITSPGSSNHAAIATLGELASEQGLAQFQMLEGQVLTNSLLNLVEGRTDLVATPFMAPFLMSRGAGPYAALGPDKGAELVQNAAVLFTYRFGGTGLFSFDSSTVHGWDDLQGKNVLNGPPQGAALTTARGLIQIVTSLKDGPGYTGVQTDWGQMVKVIRDGSVDAAVLPIYVPDSRMVQASASGNMTVFSIPKAVYESPPMKAFLTSPGNGVFEAPVAELNFPDGITVQSEDDTFRLPAITGGTVVRTDMDEELAYRLTKAYLDNLDRFENKLPLMKWVALGATEADVTGMCGHNPLKYHPGAVRAHEEAGLALPDCAKP
ncbi:TAXI family TRAP transporter solute-binding subunit [Paracoccus sp. (in: a-proteobacteria)]|uniref:TAXI family TRAP transporter solute-binding subunit n=1 Tax=Paracoccus sp. TaxID=267 RepID=UPI003A8B5953